MCSISIVLGASRLAEQRRSRGSPLTPPAVSLVSVTKRLEDVVALVVAITLVPNVLATRRTRDTEGTTG